MNKIKIIYNPDSGRRLLQRNIPRLKEIMWSEYGCLCDLVKTTGPFHAKELAHDACLEGCDIIVAAGGDGTVNEVINGMLTASQPNSGRTKLAIYPAGTVNDFGCHLKIPKTIEQFAYMLNRAESIPVDVGRAGDRYFLNVAAAGLLTDVAHRVSSEAKTFFGRFAYYFEGIKEFPKQLFHPINIQLKIGSTIEEKEILFFILANSPHVGGFKSLAPEAKTNDALLDLIFVENSQLKDMAGLFLMLLQGNHINHPNIQYLQVKEVSIACQEEIVVDVDGEYGGKLPLTFKAHQAAIDILIP
ncbi:diacylglycerol/lipid kinase family protein [Alkaliphilus crotonatoxidans]